jgi:serine/threonine protein kinase
MLSAGQMAQMSQLLEQVLELDTAGRQRWLEALHPEHQDLLPALRRALLPDGEPSTFDELATQIQPLGSGLHAGQAVDRYRLIRPLGAGGMAEVWLAERADGAFKRNVALKLPRVSPHRQDLPSRFAREREILASLEHPNIARLYDAGVSAEGLPYLAMEYVAGQPLTVWCNARRMEIRERLKLFLQVLDAVRYAHGRQVLHRDIKPSNIMVTEAGQVRLLDFGVAKLLEREEGTELTRVYGRALTPGYASPELIKGGAVEAASDVYALGVVLYELLSGSRPYRLKAGASLTVLEQAVMEAQVPKPSTQVQSDTAAARAMTVQKLSRRLRGDLDAIVLKTLARDPKDRYPSAEALADDFQRYLSGEPVVARPDHLTYRLRKFVMRHHVGVVFVATVVMLFAATIGYELTRPITGPGGTGPAPSMSAAVQGTVTAPVADKSIAVLPFVEMSEKHDQEYFSDGLSDELIDHLSHSKDLRVIARTSSFYFKGKQVTIGEIARTLTVSNVLEGSVRRAGEELRVTAKLIRASDGSDLWSQTYERRVADIFKVQDEIATTVTQALNVALTPHVNGQLHPPKPEAYNLLLQGNYFSNLTTKEDTSRAIDYYDRATRVDPDYGLAWSRLARETAHQVTWDEGAGPGARDRARDAAQHALRIAPDLAESHSTAGYVLFALDWDWKGAMAEFERGLQLDPNDMLSREDLDFLKAQRSGRLDDVIRDDRLACALDPVSTRALHDLWVALFFAAQYEEAIEVERRIAQLSPNTTRHHMKLGLALMELGRHREAVDEFLKEPLKGERLTGVSYIYWAAGRRADADAALEELERTFGSKEAYAIATVHAYRGERDAAFKWLDRAYRARTPTLSGVTLDPRLRDLHDDPRYRAFIVKLKLADEN